MMRVIIEDNEESVGKIAALYVMKKIIEYQPNSQRYFVMGLPTGSTPLIMYKYLIEFYKSGQLSFKYVKTFNMDEYVGLARDDPQSYHTFMFDHFFCHIDIDPKNVNVLNGIAVDLKHECNKYEESIHKAGGINLFVAGVGSDGHIAFNEPGSSLTSRTRIKALAHETIAANARFFNSDHSKVPKRALTVGVGTIMDANEVLVLVTGAHKALAVMKAIESGVSHMWTVSALQMHPNSLFIIDEDATLELKIKTVKYFKGLSDDLSKSIMESPYLKR